MTIDLVVQGPIGEYTQQILDAAEACPRINRIVVSHWTSDKEQLKFTPKCYEISSEDWNQGWNKFNLNKQAATTVVGLDEVTTEYVIKLRSAKWPYVKFDTIIDKFLENPDKILSSNFFFRRHNVHPFHCSDHLLVGKTSQLKQAFERVLYRCLVEDISRPYYNIESPAVEQLIGDEILAARGITSRTRQDMVDAFEIIRIDDACNLSLFNSYRRHLYIHEVPRHHYYNVVNEISQL